MAVEKNSVIQKWWEHFENDALDSLDRLLFRTEFMGEFERNDTDEILFRLFHNQSEKVRQQLDEVMQEWFNKYWGKIPAALPTRRWARILKDAFIVVNRLNLAHTYFFIREIYINDKSWLRSIRVDSSRDPEGELLRTLALTQEDRSLLSLWMRLCRMEEDLPIDYTSIGLLGLRKLPEENGKPPKDLPGAFFKGAVSLAEALGQYNRDEFMESWLREMRAVVAYYPRSKQYWANYFSPFLHGNNKDVVVEWLNKVIPKLFNDFNTRSSANVYIQPPSHERLNHFLNLIERNEPLETFRSDLEIFLEEHRRYALQTGDASFLVNTFSDIGYKLVPQDSNLALALLEDAFNWEPHNPFLWSQLANIEKTRGHETRAAALLWEAMQRFPENVKIRSNLAYLLAQQGKLETAEIIYRQAMADFPKDVVCRNGLAVVLLKQKKNKEAISLLQKTIAAFPDNKIAKELLEKIAGKKEFTGLTNLDIKEASAFDKRFDFDLFPGDESDFHTPLPTTEFHDTTGTGEMTVMAKAFAQNDVSYKPIQASEFHYLPDTDVITNKSFESSGISMVRSGEPVTYGEKQFPRPANLTPELGEIMINFRSSRDMAPEEKENYHRKLAADLDRLLEKSPGNLMVLFAQSLLFIDRAPGDAQPSLSRLSQSYPHSIGFRLLELRSQALETQPEIQTKWNDLIHDFPNRSTIIKLEQSLDTLQHANGKDHGAVECLEKLRIRFSKDIKHLPPTLQKNEEWVRDTIEKRLFKDINIKESLTPTVLETLKKNYLDSMPILQDTVNLCLYSAI